MSLPAVKALLSASLSLSLSVSVWLPLFFPSIFRSLGFAVLLWSFCLCLCFLLTQIRTLAVFFEAGV